MSNTKITFETLVPAIALAGLVPLEQSAFWKVAQQKKALYISKTKSRVTRIDVSGFSVEHPAILPPAKKNGKVTGQIQMDHPLALEAIELAMLVLVNGEVVGDKVK